MPKALPPGTPVGGGPPIRKTPVTIEDSLPDWWAIISAGKVVDFTEFDTAIGAAVVGEYLPAAYGHIKLNCNAPSFGEDGGYAMIRATGVIAVCEGEIESIDEFDVNGAEFAEGHTNFPQVGCSSDVSFFMGATGETPSTLLPAIWDRAYFQNVAHVGVQFWGTAFGGIIPWWRVIPGASPGSALTFSAEIHAKKLYDPRSPSDPPAYSALSALIVRDLLTAYGKTLAAGIDDDSFAAAADVCETNGFVCNIAFTEKTPLKDAIDAVLATCCGKLVPSNGKIGLFIDAANVGDAVLTLDEAAGTLTDVVYEWLDVETRPTRVIVRFKDEANRYAQTDTPAKDDPGLKLGLVPLREKILTLPGVTTMDQAVKLRDYYFKSYLNSTRITGGCGLAGTVLSPGTKIRLKTLAGTDNECMVEQATISDDGFWKLVAWPYDPDIYVSTPIETPAPIPPPVVGPPVVDPTKIPDDVTVTDSFPYEALFSASATEKVFKGYPSATYTLPADVLLSGQLRIRSYVGSDAESKTWDDMEASEMLVPLNGNTPPDDDTHFNLAALNNPVGDDTTGYDALGRITGESVYFERWRLLIRVQGINDLLSGGVTVDCPPIITVSSVPVTPPTPAHAVKYLDLDDVALGGLTTDNAWQGVCFGAANHVAVAATGSGNRVMTSADGGATWTTRVSAADLIWSGPAYGAGVLVAVAWDAVTQNVMTSADDGVTWALRTGAETNHWNDVCFGGSLFVAVSSDGTHQVMTSPDGDAWTARTCPAGSWRAVIHDGTNFIALGGTSGANQVMTSPDGVTWTARTPAEANSWTALAAGGGVVVAVANTGGSPAHQVMTSSDHGVTWTARTAAAALDWNDVAHGAGVFVAVAQTGTGNRFMSSSDGVTWASRTSPADSSWKSVTFGGSLFVTVAQLGTGYRVATSSDGLTWTGQTGTGGTAIDVAPASTLRLISADGTLKGSHSGGAYATIGGGAGVTVEEANETPDGSLQVFSFDTDVGAADRVCADGVFVRRGASGTSPYFTASTDTVTFVNLHPLETVNLWRMT